MEWADLSLLFADVPPSAWLVVIVALALLGLRTLIPTRASTKEVQNSREGWLAPQEVSHYEAVKQELRDVQHGLTEAGFTNIRLKDAIRQLSENESERDKRLSQLELRFRSSNRLDPRAHLRSELDRLSSLLDSHSQEMISRFSKVDEAISKLADENDLSSKFQRSSSVQAAALSQAAATLLAVVWDVLGKYGRELRTLSRSSVHGGDPKKNPTLLTPEDQVAYEELSDQLERLSGHFRLVSGDPSTQGSALMTLAGGTGDSETLELVETLPVADSTETQAWISVIQERTNRKRDQGQAAAPPPVFVCYAHEDNKKENGRWLDRLLVHVEPLSREAKMRTFSDKQLKIGEDWDPKIRQALDEARAAVLLVSPAFLASEYIANSELPTLLRAAKERGTQILPLHVRPSAFATTQYQYESDTGEILSFKLSDIQAANPPEETLVELDQGRQDRVLVALVERLRDIVTES